MEQLKQGLRCPECQLLLRDPVQTEEGDRLCSSCYDAIKRTGVSKSGIVLGEDAVSFMCYSAVRRCLARCYGFVRTHFIKYTLNRNCSVIRIER